MLATMTGTQGQLPTVISVSGDGGSWEVESTIPAHPGWKAALTIEVGEQGYAVTRCCVVPHDPDEVPAAGLRTSTLRGVPIASIVRAAFTEQRPGTIGWLVDQIDGPGTADEIATVVDPGPRRRDDAFYARVAVDWERHTAAGSGARARMAAERNLNELTVRNLVSEATRRGLLDRSKATGPRMRRASDRARTILEQEGEQP